jgi:transcriptional regulator with XRE-family HTH domain
MHLAGKGKREVFDRDRMRRLMKARNMTQQKLAGRCALTQGHISLILSGRIAMPTYDTLKAMAKALGTSVESITKTERAEDEQGR